MTQREREILKASVSWTDKTLTVKEEKAFQAGAEWADKTMIEKACKWMKLRLVARIGSEGAHEFLTEFRKAMEE